MDFPSLKDCSKAGKMIQEYHPKVQHLGFIKKTNNNNVHILWYFIDNLIIHKIMRHGLRPRRGHGEALEILWASCSRFKTKWKNSL